MEYKHKLVGRTIKAVIMYPAITRPRMSYSLFEKKTDGRCMQVRSESYPTEKAAWQVYGGPIIKSPLSLSIRKVSVKVGKAEGLSHFGRNTWNEFKDSPLRERVVR